MRLCYTKEVLHSVNNIMYTYEIVFNFKSLHSIIKDIITLLHGLCAYIVTVVIYAFHK